MARLTKQLLRFSGTRPRIARITSRLAVDCVLSCETRLIIVDDVHLIDFGHRSGLEVSNHLKSLANEMPATFVYVDVQLQEKRFFDEGRLGEHAAYTQTFRHRIQRKIRATAGQRVG